MNPLLISGILTTVKAGLAWLTARQNGDRGSAIDILEAVDLRPFGLDEGTLELVNYMKVGLSYISKRGGPIEDSLAIIEAAEEAGTDVTPESVKDLIIVAEEELEDTQNLIDDLSDDSSEDEE